MEPFLHPCFSNDPDQPFVPSQQTQEEQPTQINQELPDYVPTPSQCDPQPSDPQPWATLHALTLNVPKKNLMPNVNVLCIGREKNRDPRLVGTAKEDLVIKIDNNSQAAISISRKHCIIQRKGVDDDDFDDADGANDLVRMMRRNATMPYNGQSGREVISLLDLSSNGTFINGKKCQPNQWTKLEHGDHIALDSLLGRTNRPSRAYEWMISIPSQRINPMNKRPEAHSETGQKFYKRFDLISPLGQGAFATTWKAFDRKVGDYKAIKIIQKSEHKHNPRMSPHLDPPLFTQYSYTGFFHFGFFDCFEENIENFKREVEILKLVDHPNIVKFYKCKDDDDYIWIVLELVDGGEYLDYVCNADGLDEESCRVITAMLLQAIAYLAALRIAHRDLKPENILMTSGNNPRPKIADFGLAKQLVGPSDVMFKTQCGTPAYLAPEVVVPSLTNPKKKGYTVAVDMYSLGVIVYAALGNCSPFDGQEQKGDIRQICRNRKVDPRVLAQLKPGVSEAALEFIAALTEKNVAKRLTAEQALRHRWITDAVSQWPPKEAQLPTNPFSSSQEKKNEEPQPELMDNNEPTSPRPESPCPVQERGIDFLPNERIPPIASSSLFDIKSNVSGRPSGKATSTEYDPADSASPAASGRPAVSGGKRKVHEVNEMCSQQLRNMRLETPRRRGIRNAGRENEEDDGQNHSGETSAPPSCGCTIQSTSTPSPFSTAPPPLLSNTTNNNNHNNNKALLQQTKNKKFRAGQPCYGEQPDIILGSKRKLRQWSTSPKLVAQEDLEEPMNEEDEQVLLPDLLNVRKPLLLHQQPQPVIMATEETFDSEVTPKRRSSRIPARKSSGKKKKVVVTSMNASAAPETIKSPSRAACSPIGSVRSVERENKVPLKLSCNDNDVDVTPRRVLKKNRRN